MAMPQVRDVAVVVKGLCSGSLLTRPADGAGTDWGVHQSFAKEVGREVECGTIGEAIPSEKGASHAPESVRFCRSLAGIE